MPEEVRFFGRLAVWGIVVGAGYWLLTREPVGSVVLVGFGVGNAFLAVMFARDVNRTGRGRSDERPWRWVGLPSEEPDRPPFGDESGRIPAGSLAPVQLGLGVGLAALGLVFGPWLYLAAAAPIAVGLADWFRGAVEEYRATERGGDEERAEPS